MIYKEYNITRFQHSWRVFWRVYKEGRFVGSYPRLRDAKFAVQFLSDSGMSR